MEESLEQCRNIIERLKSALHESISGIIVLDFDRTIQFVNTYWAGLTGYTRQEVLSKNFSTFFSESEYARIEQAFKLTKEKGKCFIEVTAKKKDGTTIPLLIRFILSKGDNQEPIGFVGSARDITEQKRREQRLEKQKVELERFNELMKGRELKMIELKKEINALYQQAGKQPKYDIAS